MLGALRARLATVFASAPAAVPVSAGKSSAVARDRLAIMIATQRGTTRNSNDDMLQGVDLKALQQDLLDCVKVSRPLDLCVRACG